VWWTKNSIPDVAIEMKVTISLKSGATVKSATKAIMEVVEGNPSIFGQAVNIQWKYGSKTWDLDSADPWEFSMK
jgi:hypothetical protein